MYVNTAFIIRLRMHDSPGGGGIWSDMSIGPGLIRVRALGGDCTRASHTISAVRFPIFLGIIGLLAAPVAVQASGLEFAGYVGPVLSPYEQSVVLNPAGLVLPGGAVVPGGQALRLEASGGNSVAGALTLYLADALGLEIRLDMAKLNLDVTGATYRVVVDLPAPLPDATGDLELGSGPMDVERIRPLSLNLKLRTPGRVRLALSGGLSYLPELRVVSAQAVRLRSVAVPGVPAGAVLATVGLRADALPEQEDDNGRFGANGGVGLQVQLATNLLLVGEGRGFVFRRHRLQWERAGGALSPLEQALATELERRLDPVDFNPNFFQASVGLALSF